MDLKELTERDIDRIIEMAWEDRTPFDAISLQFGPYFCPQGNRKSKALNSFSNLLSASRVARLLVPQHVPF